jgi:hypothetical protein
MRMMSYTVSRAKPVEVRSMEGLGVTSLRGVTGVVEKG